MKDATQFLTSEVISFLKEHLNRKGFYTRRAIQKILRDKNLSVPLSMITSALRSLAKEKLMIYNKDAKLWMWSTHQIKEEQTEPVIVFKPEYIKNVKSEILDYVKAELHEIVAAEAIECVDACIDNSLTKLILNHTEKVILNEIRVNFRSQVNQHIKDVTESIVSNNINDTKQKILKLYRKDFEAIEKGMVDLNGRLCDLESKFNF